MNRCALCPGKYKCLPHSGNLEAPNWFIGEAPGKVEEREGVVFSGPTGKEVNQHYLPLAGLRRDQVLMVNGIRCWPDTPGHKLDTGNAKHLALLDSCITSYLHPLIERAGPKTLIPLGAFAARALGLDINLELAHGIPTISPWDIRAYPMYHPAQGIHEPKKMLNIRTDWYRLKAFLGGRLVVPRDSFTEPDYAEVTDASEFEALDSSQPLACDTESKRDKTPYCFTYSQWPGVGRLIRGERRDLLAVFQRHLSEWQAPILFHNWLYDWAVTTALGLEMPVQRVVDTMARVFHLGNLPQGLKALAYRELGMVMDDFDDVVSPYSTENVLHYYEIAKTYDWPKPEEELAQDSATGLWKLYKPQGMNTKFKRFFTDYSKKPDKDVFQAWENWETSHAMIESQLGPWPGKCISHVPFEKMLYYSCRDADALIRVWGLLEGMRRRVRKVSQEQWRAA